MPDPMPRLTPRSAGASADVALLRAARTDAAPPEPAAATTLGDRLRGLVPSRAVRVAAGSPLAVRPDRRGA